MAILIDHGNLKRSVLRSRRLEKANKIRQELREKYDYIPWLNRIIPKFSKKVHEAEALPRFYSCAYVDWYRGYKVAYPIPFALIIRVLRWAYFESFKMRPLVMDMKFRRAWQLGKEQGLKEGREEYDNRKRDDSTRTM